MDAKRLAVAIILSLLTLQTMTSCEEGNLGIDDDLGHRATDVEGWFFRAAYVYPVAVTFEPVVLYKDGDYVEVEDEPVEGIDEAADRRERPEAWGTWRKEGDNYYLTDYEGHTEDYQLGSESWYPAYPYMDDVPLATGYVNSTGGDYGNGTHALFQTRIDSPR